MFFPPTSGRKAVRLQNAAVIDELSGIYSTLMSVWIEEKETEKGSDDMQDEQPEANVPDGEAGVENRSVHPSVASSARAGWAFPLRKRLLAIVEQLNSIKIQTAMARFEGNIRGAWPAEEYGKLLEQEGDMLAALGQVNCSCIMFCCFTVDKHSLVVKCLAKSGSSLEGRLES